MSVGIDVEVSTVRQVLPVKSNVSVRYLIERLAAGPVAVPFSTEVVDFCAALSRRLRREARGHAEIQSLAFWMRDTEIARRAAEFAQLRSDRVMLAPRGTVFHLPPGNVDTMFVYSWLMSALVGNRNVVRLSSRASKQATLIIDVLHALLDDGAHPGIAAANVMIEYGRDTAITDELSHACDMRVIWGGDATVRAVRRSPLPPHAIELTFPDRFSLAAINGSAYLALVEHDRERLVERFFNDAYVFDQMACSSPRLIVWVCAETQMDSAAMDFFARLAATVDRRKYEVPTATAVAKLAYACRAAIDYPVQDGRSFGSRLTALRLAEFAQIRDQFCGGGVFFQLRLDSLLDLAEHIERRDQTLAQFGFSADELTEFVHVLNGRGVDRVVPIGRALTFDRIWDGHDLLQSFTRRTTVDVAEVSPGWTT